jgi:hypothetical protein
MLKDVAKVEFLHNLTLVLHKTETILR